MTSVLRKLKIKRKRYFSDKHTINLNTNLLILLRFKVKRYGMSVSQMTTGFVPFIVIILWSFSPRSDSSPDLKQE